MQNKINKIFTVFYMMLLLIFIYASNGNCQSIFDVKGFWKLYISNICFVTYCDSSKMIILSTSLTDEDSCFLGKILIDNIEKNINNRWKGITYKIDCKDNRASIYQVGEAEIKLLDNDVLKIGSIVAQRVIDYDQTINYCLNESLNEVTVPKSSFDVVQSGVNEQKITQKKEAVVENKKFALIVNTDPHDAVVKIMNIKPIYKPGIMLSPGKYYIEVSKKNYKTFREMKEIINADISFKVVLKKENKNEKIFDKDFGIELILIHSGEFVMGSPLEETGRFEDETQHKVILTNDFYMQTTEVNQKQWKLVMGDNPSLHPYLGDRGPISNVSWNDVQTFIKKLNREKGKNLYRLPTEAEWEYACRSGTSTPYYFGCCLSQDLANIERNSPNLSKCFPANAWGLYDMHGNVYELCMDKCEWDFENERIITTTYKDMITNPINKTGSYRIVRGGSYDLSAIHSRSASRGRVKPNEGFPFVGFRLVRDVKAKN